MPDACPFSKYERIEVVDEVAEEIRQYHYIPKCSFIESNMGNCPYPAKQCAYKRYDDPASVEGDGWQFAGKDVDIAKIRKIWEGS